MCCIARAPSPPERQCREAIDGMCGVSGSHGREALEEDPADRRRVGTRSGDGGDRPVERKRLSGSRVPSRRVRAPAHLLRSPGRGARAHRGAGSDARSCGSPVRGHAATRQRSGEQEDRALQHRRGRGHATRAGVSIELPRRRCVSRRPGERSLCGAIARMTTASGSRAERNSPWIVSSKAPQAIGPSACLWPLLSRLTPV